MAAVTMLVAIPATAASDAGAGMMDGLAGGGDARLLVLWVCAAVGAVVYAAMIGAIVRSREPRARAHRPAVEVAWIVLVAAIMVATAMPAVQELVHGEEASEVRMASPGATRELANEGGAAAGRLELVGHSN